VILNCPIPTWCEYKKLQTYSNGGVLDPNNSTVAKGFLCSFRSVTSICGAYVRLLRSECCTQCVAGESMTAPRGNCSLAPTEQSRARIWTGRSTINEVFGMTRPGNPVLQLWWRVLNQLYHRTPRGPQTDFWRSMTFLCIAWKQSSELQNYLSCWSSLQKTTSPVQL